MEMEETIDLQELFQILKKRLMMIITFALTAAVFVGGFTFFFVTPIYQTSTQLVVSPGNEGGVTHSDIQANIQLINTYNGILTSPAILHQVIDQLGLEMSAGGLASLMTAGNQTNSQIITLTVRHEDPVLAQRIAELTADIFINDVPDIMHVDNVSILAPAQIPSSPVSPRLTMNVAIGFVVGAMGGVFVAFLLEFLDKTVKTEHEVEQLTSLPVLGVISIMTVDDIRAQRS
ncbi:MAG: Wzz/FepE/Etk N-terminal domain-containing protein [Turicibacter sp.]|nr:Wzz/FepE/Etk N-terminal domain-containing protein [Turicibacter sp.]